MRTLLNTYISSTAPLFTMLILLRSKTKTLYWYLREYGFDFMQKSTDSKTPADQSGQISDDFEPSHFDIKFFELWKVSSLQ
jgi:hypothetical protein